MAVVLSACSLGKVGELQKFFQTGRRKMTDCADSFGNFVNDFIKLVVNVFEEFVFVLKIRPFHVPMCLTRLGNEDYFVGQDLAQ